jgi:hypothetical protein
MADLAERQATRHDISLFSLDRLTGQRSLLAERRRYPALLEEEEAMPHQPGSPARGRHPARYRRARRYTIRRQRPPMQIERRLRPTARVERWRPRRHTVVHRLDDPYRRWDTTDPDYWTADDVEPFWL